MAKKGNKSSENMDTSKVKECLMGVAYPADKEELIQHAKNTCGDEEVISMLKDLPEQSYGGATQLTNTLEKVLGGIHLRLDL